ncbi:hypothetical protein QYE76_028027 [Lolium multiflorum]|uniref:DUF4283 domain-containing protein n=1 Tax=Lolium multiflorum TaxID=4521 RepID=A0AAD8VFF3_LOLMU|nr:hypothetical protein QYE76_028027 [Lolium multiflorum]
MVAGGTTTTGGGRADGGGRFFHDRYGSGRPGSGGGLYNANNSHDGFNNPNSRREGGRQERIVEGSSTRSRGLVRPRGRGAVGSKVSCGAAALRISSGRAWRRERRPYQRRRGRPRLPKGRQPARWEVEGEQFEAVIHFTTAPLTVEQLSDELKSLLDDLWDWQVARVSDTEYCMRFPSRGTLRMSMRRGKIYLPLSKCDIDIREAFVSPRPGPAFPSVWVQITGLLGDMMVKNRLMAAMTMIGRSVDVDELSIKKWKTEPVRMRFQCRYPERVKGMVQVCVNSEPFTSGIHAELGAPGAGGSGGLPCPPESRDDEDGDDLQSEERSSDGEAWNRHRRRGSDKEKAKGSDKQGGGPGLGRFGILVDANEVGALGKEDDVMPLSVPDNGTEEASLVSGETASQVTDLVGSWLRDSPTVEPTSPISISEDMVVDMFGTPAGVAGVGADHQLAPPQDLHGEMTAAVSLVQGKRTKVVLVSVDAPTRRTKKTAVTTTPVRKSTRNAGAASTNMMKKPQSLAAAKNLELPSATGLPQVALELVRAKEQVQAALAVVAARNAQEELARLAREAASPGSVSREDDVPIEASGEPPEATDAGGQASSDEGVTICNLRAHAWQRRPRLTVHKGGEGTPIRQSRFFFQTWWFGVPGFGDLLGEKLRCYISDRGPHWFSVELWQYVSRNSRQFLKRWGANLGREKRDYRANLLRQVEDLDRVADSNGLDEEGWDLRYFLEDQLVVLDRVDEEYWR